MSRYLHEGWDACEGIGDVRQFHVYAGYQCRDGCLGTPRDNLCVDMWIGLCIGMCMDHVYTHAYTHVPGHVYEHMCTMQMCM